MLNLRLAIFKEGYVYESGEVKENQFLQGHLNYATAVKKLDELGSGYFCQEQELDSLTKEWISNDSDPLYPNIETSK